MRFLKIICGQHLVGLMLTVATDMEGFWEKILSTDNNGQTPKLQYLAIEINSVVTERKQKE